MAASGTGTAYVIINGGNFRDARIKGEGDECYLFGDAQADGHHFATTDAFTSGVCDVRHCDRLGLQLITESDDGQTLTGAWMVELSNNYTPASTGTAYGQVAGEAGKWTDVTDLFSPAIEVVAADSNQYAQMDLRARSLRVTFTPTAS